MGRLATKLLACLALQGVDWNKTAKTAFEYGYYVHHYEDKGRYFEKNPARLQKGLVLGHIQDLLPGVPVLRELPGGAVYLCQVLSSK